MHVIKRKIKSLKKNLFVTLIDFCSPDAYTLRAITTVVMNKQLPIKLLIKSMRSPFSGESPPAAIAENTSGAPLPKASSVTPANDSEHLNLSEMASKAGDRYESDVEPKVHTPIESKIN